MAEKTSSGEFIRWGATPSGAPKQYQQRHHAKARSHRLGCGDDFPHIRAGEHASSQERAAAVAEESNRIELALSEAAVVQAKEQLIGSVASRIYEEAAAAPIPDAQGAIPELPVARGKVHECIVEAAKIYDGID